MTGGPEGLLQDLNDRTTAAATYVRGRSFADYGTDRMLRSAVERQFTVLGEISRRLSFAAPGLAGKLPELGAVADISQDLQERYYQVNNGLVWHAAHHLLAAHANAHLQALGEE